MFRLAIVLVLVALQGTLQLSPPPLHISDMMNCPQIQCPMDRLIPAFCREDSFVPGLDGRPCQVCDGISSKCDKLKDTLSQHGYGELSCPLMYCIGKAAIPDNCRESTYFLSSDGHGGKKICQGCDKNKCTEPSLTVADCPQINCNENKPIPPGCEQEVKLILNDEHTVCTMCSENKCQYI